MLQSVRWRRLSWQVALVCALAACGSPARSADGVLSRGPYLQMGTPDSMAILWRTEGPIRPTVRYGRSPDQLDHVVEDDGITVRVSPDQSNGDDLPRLHSAPEQTYQYEAQLTGLEAGTEYYYQVFDGERALAGGDADHRFATHPQPGQARPLRFWVVGDSGTGGKDQKLVHDAMRQFTGDQDRPLDLYVHVGDMAYGSGTDDQFQERFFEIYQPTLRNVVCWPAMGNHEGHTSKGETGVGPYYDAYRVPTRGEAGGAASGTEAYYAFDYGRVHFVCLDSHDLDRSPAGAMAQWLRADLEKTNADWLIAFWHHPPYTKGSHDSDRERQLVEMRTHVMPILESAGVDLVLTGHSHIYERSMLIDGAYATPTTAEGVVLDDGDGDPSGDGSYRKSAGLRPNEGAVQVVAGHGGAGLSRKGTMPVMKRILLEHGSVVVDVDGDALTAVMINKHGETRDLFQIVKRGEVSPQRIADPWRPEPPSPEEMRPPGKLPRVLVPKNAVQLVKPHEHWEYLAGEHPPEDWNEFDFHTEGWSSGRAGFGYGDDDDMTQLKGMRGKYSVVYTRTEFGEPPAAAGELGLVINYDDGFIAYLNGQEVQRVGVKKGSGTDAGKIDSHEADGYHYIPLPGARKHLRPDENLLAIEGHNRKIDSSDFTLDAYFIFVPQDEKEVVEEKAEKEARTEQEE
ncbi:purple acid phosphatase family protein [Alienimonas californiensis]|uniref:Alkaline phosphatase n=1 Tax=Alienimonas californiensis TaxID=2527989 RepID=A0A517P4E8_9PLAN|nr:metallophosphoesterase family protein [Alienimonas californiensis]QDT14268.1 Alkaline phosphatase precursor [Alienimonas californiensis]